MSDRDALPPLPAPVALLSVAVLDADQARALTDAIKTDLGSLAANIAAAFQGRAWEPLGYSSWSQYTAAEFTLDQYRLPKGTRRDEVLATLADAGMSQRQIAAATGLNQSTISRALAPGDANASPEVDPVASMLADPDGWRVALSEYEDRVHEAVRRPRWPRDEDRVHELELCILVMLATNARVLWQLRGCVAFNGLPEGARVRVRALAEHAVLDLPLVWTPVREFLRAAQQNGYDVRGLVAQAVRDDLDPTTLSRAAEVLTILGGT